MNSKVTAPLNKDMTLSNGVVIMTNGTTKTKERKIIPLKEGGGANRSGKVMPRIITKMQEGYR